jgi:hypothetical protein
MRYAVPSHARRIQSTVSLTRVHSCALKVLAGTGAGNPDALKWRVSGYAHRMDGMLKH